MPHAAPTVYLNGTYLPYSDATLSVEDRGTLFGDGVYEVLRYYAGRAFAMPDHTARLGRSLAGIDLHGVDVDALADASDELVQRNRLADAKVYWQVTRGPATRSHLIPDPPDLPEPTVLILAYPADPAPTTPRDAAAPTTTAATVEDTRWTQCWIKSLMLLPNSLARTRAHAAGAGEAVFCRAKPGTDAVHVTEGSTTNLMIVRGGELFTHPDDGWVLGGVTRLAVLRLAGELSIPVHEQPFTPDQMLAADEVFICGTTSEVTAVTAIDGRPMADAAAGPVTSRLYRAYLEAAAGATAGVSRTEA